jgi:DNA-binding PadR family transcriptional regulator
MVEFAAIHYEIKHIIEEHTGDWTSIAFGSIHFALRKLAEEGFIGGPSLPQSGPDVYSNYAIVKERSKVI